MYGDCKFKLTKTTWVMFHDEKFELMKKLAQKYGVTYKSKEIKMIASNVYLEIENCILQEHYFNLNSILFYQYQSKIKDCVVKEVEGKQVWIVWFESLKASIYAYFYLSDLSYKVRFIRGASHFKNSLANSPNQAVAGAQMTEYMGYNQGYQQSPIYPSNPYLQHYQPNEYQGYMQGYR